MIDYYSILGVSPSATLEEIRSAYRQRARSCHPDRGGSHEAMVDLNTAYHILSNPDSRAAYDAQREGRSLAARAAFEHTEHEARQTAAVYPPTWAEFEQWMNQLLGAVARDFKKETYSNRFRGVPMAGNSISGGIFALAGIVIGCILLAPLLPVFFVWLLLPAFGGAGSAVHAVFREIIKAFDPSDKR